MSLDGSLPRNSGLEGLLIAAVYTLLFEYVRHKLKSIHYEHAYWGERRGRTRVEQEMRKLTNVQLNTSNGFFVQPIGHIFSCYRQCVGTPRQGALVPLSRASLVLTNNMSPESLDGLEEFSHIWLTFKFHLNTNTLKEAKAFIGVVGDGNSKRNYTFKAKIVPPMLKEKKGVLATRSPHRPNPVGVTLARIERVDKRTRTIHLSCCDLVDGTPIYDVKPYVPAYDNVSPFRVPTWIAETIDTRNQVIIPQTVLDTIKFNSSAVHNGNDDMVSIKPKRSSLESSLREYKNDIDTFIRAIIQTLEVEVRSKFQTKRRIKDANSNITVEVPFDNTIVSYYWRDDRVLEISKIELYDPQKHNELAMLKQQEELQELENLSDNENSI